jgi:hypothetical protein
MVGYSSMATIGLRPPPDDVVGKKGCKVRIARFPGTSYHWGQLSALLGISSRCVFHPSRRIAIHDDSPKLY